MQQAFNLRSTEHSRGGGHFSIEAKFNGDHDVRVGIRLCESRCTGANPVGLANLIVIARTAKSSSHRTANPNYPVQDRGARPFHRPWNDGKLECGMLNRSRSAIHFSLFPFQSGYPGTGCDSRILRSDQRGAVQIGRARPFPNSIPPRRGERRTPPVSARDWCKASWRIHRAL